MKGIIYKWTKPEESKKEDVKQEAVTKQKKRK